MTNLCQVLMVTVNCQQLCNYIIENKGVIITVTHLLNYESIQWIYHNRNTLSRSILTSDEDFSRVTYVLLWYRDSSDHE